MKRREFISGCRCVGVAACGVWAQQSSPIRRIGVLMGFPEGDTLAQSYVAAMRQRLAELGWLENRNIQIVHRWGGGDPEKTRAFAKELVGMSPSVIVTSTNQATETMRQETQTIPIVFACLAIRLVADWSRASIVPAETLRGFRHSWRRWAANGLS